MTRRPVTRKHLLVLQQGFELQTNPEVDRDTTQERLPPTWLPLRAALRQDIFLRPDLACSVRLTDAKCHFCFCWITSAAPDQGALVGNRCPTCRKFLFLMLLLLQIHLFSVLYSLQSNPTRYRTAPFSSIHTFHPQTKVKSGTFLLFQYLRLIYWL